MGEAGMFGPYRVGELLGRGGMGTVHRALDTRRERVVALKRLDERFVDDPGYRERFRRECRLAARLSSPHVVPIHDFGEIDDVLFLDMRLVDGRGLDEVLRDGPLSPDRAARTVEQIAHALDAAHAAGLVHRDVKPSNVLVGEPDGFVHLADFGIARTVDPGTRSALTGSGGVPGTLAYLAPESFVGGPADHRADVYGLACVLYQTLTGRRPFDGDAAQLMYHHLHTPPPDPGAVRDGLPPGLAGVVRYGMAKDPTQRPASAGELARLARDAVTATASAGDRDHIGPGPPAGTVVGTQAAVGPEGASRGARVSDAVTPARRRGRTGVLVAALVTVGLVAGAIGLAVSTTGTSSSPDGTATADGQDTTALRLAFPESGRPGCAPASPPTTSAGRAAQASLACDYPATRARAEFVQWPTPSDAALATRDAGDPRTSYESEWKIDLVPQGPVYFGQDGAGGWLAVGAYRDRRYGFAVRAPTREQLSATFPAMRFLPPDQLPA